MSEYYSKYTVEINIAHHYSLNLKLCYNIKAHEDCADEGETENSGTKVDHHFVAYINIDDRLIEFDSSQSFPRDCGITDPTSFLSDAGKVCMDLMLKLDDKISCNAIALVKS